MEPAPVDADWPEAESALVPDAFVPEEVSPDVALAFEPESAPVLSEAVASAVPGAVGDVSVAADDEVLSLPSALELSPEEESAVSLFALALSDAVHVMAAGFAPTPCPAVTTSMTKALMATATSAATTETTMAVTLAFRWDETLPAALMFPRRTVRPVVRTSLAVM